MILYTLNTLQLLLFRLKAVKDRRRQPPGP